MILTAKEIEDKAWLKYPYTYRNNRGACKTERGYITYGLPEPPHGRKEQDDEMKGGDRVGFDVVEITPEMVGKKIAVFANIEIKTQNDRLKTGQIRFHNFVLESGGISEIWQENKNGEIEVINNEYRI